jgi:hypothetical protein
MYIHVLCLVYLSLTLAVSVRRWLLAMSWGRSLTISSLLCASSQRFSILMRWGDVTMYVYVTYHPSNLIPAKGRATYISLFIIAWGYRTAGNFRWCKISRNCLLLLLEEIFVVLNFAPSPRGDHTYIDWPTISQFIFSRCPIYPQKTWKFPAIRY